MAYLIATALTGVALLALHVVGTILYRLFFHPLAKVPGPKLAAITWYYERYFDLWPNYAQFWKKIGELHEQYGPIVRINPNEVHIVDPNLIDVVYPGGGKRVDKDPYVMSQFGLLNDATFMTFDHDTHRMRRNTLNRYFSKAAVGKFEPYIKQSCEKLTKRLLDYRGKGPMTISSAYSSFTTDVITEYLFGESFEYLDRERFLPNLQPASDSFGAMLPTLRFVPWLSSAMRLVSNEQLVKMNPGMGEWLAMEATAERHVTEARARLEKDEKREGKASSGYYNIVDEWLHTDLPDYEKQDHRLALEATGLIGAAIETTAWALSFITFKLYENKELFQKLRAELLKEAPDSQIPSLAKLEALPYFSALVTEALRATGGPVSRLPRIYSDDPTVLRSTHNGKPVEYTVPPKTVLSMSSTFIHNNPELFPEPHEFKPERWLDESGKRKRDMEKYLMHFSRGTRGCVGLNLATAEIYMGIAALVLQVGDHLELHETDARDVKTVYDNFAPRPYKGSQGIRVVLK